VIERVKNFLIGQVFSERVVSNLSRTQIVQYAGASDDFNPLHTDEVFATQAAGYPSVIAHGMLTMGLTSKALTNLVGDGRLTRFGGRFLGVVWPGDDLDVRIEVVAKRESDAHSIVEFLVATSNQNQEPVFLGTAAARID
jgi:acyl dehydratase